MLGGYGTGYIRLSCTEAVALSVTLCAVVTWDSGVTQYAVWTWDSVFFKSLLFNLFLLVTLYAVVTWDSGFSKRLLVVTWGCTVGSRLFFR